MLDEVSRTPFGIGLDQAADIEGKAEGEPALRGRVGLDRIAKAVGQHAAADRRVLGQGLRPACLARMRSRPQRQP
ncbi:hypothetical protein [Phenylobacterium sp.]|uniref:hypothetical protein n=1 Tax=Phenylobacterium sp. TaxID=1871053 RepID=UPI002F932C32